MWQSRPMLGVSRSFTAQLLLSVSSVSILFSHRPQYPGLDSYQNCTETHLLKRPIFVLFGRIWSQHRLPWTLVSTAYNNSGLDWSTFYTVLHIYAICAIRYFLLYYTRISYLFSKSDNSFYPKFQLEYRKADMSNLASKLGHIGPKWEKSRTF